MSAKSSIGQDHNRRKLYAALVNGYADGMRENFAAALEWDDCELEDYLKWIDAQGLNAVDSEESPRLYEYTCGKVIAARECLRQF